MKQRDIERIKTEILNHTILCDGAFGTYYAQKFDTRELPESANTLYPERVMEIHKEYITAGARFLRTNTFASNTTVLQTNWEGVQANLRCGYGLAMQAAKEGMNSGDGTVYVAADIGQIPNEDPAAKECVIKEYMDICQVFLEEGARFLVFETLSDMEDIRPALELIGNRAFVIVQFAVNQYGYSNAGLSARRLLQKAAACQWVDAMGFNCGVGPAHMQQIISGLTQTINKPLTAFPNAGYPQNISNRMSFYNENLQYFAAKLEDLVLSGADLIGGCCGTTPEHIGMVQELLQRDGRLLKQQRMSKSSSTSDENPIGDGIQGGVKGAVVIQNNAFFAEKENRKLIAVELAPPLGSNDEALMDAAHLLQKSGVDVLTFPDSPSGRTRADSVLIAEKVARETGMCVMPHLCCRDKNAIAIRSQMLGAYINGIHNFLVITGDPIPLMVRSAVKSVFNFDSVGLMQIINDMNEEQFVNAPICYGGAINQTRRNLEVEIGRVKKKMAAGAEFFLTQPVSTLQGVERLRTIKQETGARILCGIMPFVSLKNATFMKNEMTGIEVSEEVLQRYRPDMTREEGERVGIELAREMIALTEDFVDGYYFSFPFNRVGMLEKILQKS